MRSQGREVIFSAWPFLLLSGHIQSNTQRTELVQGFIVIASLLVTAGAQLLFEGEMPPLLVWIAFPLVIISTYVHANYPYKQADKEKEQ